MEGEREGNREGAKKKDLLKIKYLKEGKRKRDLLNE
jgi:hypothetical protein